MAPAADQVHATLRRSWQCSPGPCIPLGDDAWRVGIDDGQFDATRLDGDQFVVKWAPVARRRGFEAGLCAAEHVDASGVCAGRPVRAADGALTTRAGDGVLALLCLVPGRPLRADDPLDQSWWGGALGAVHRSLRRFVHPDLARFQAATAPAAAPHLATEPWLGPAVADTAAVVRRIMITDQLTYGVRHGSPAAARFRLDSATGRVGLVGWAGSGTGPLLYDLAHAVLCAGGTGTDALVEAYVRAGPVPADECAAILPPMLALRAATHAVTVAAKIHAGVGTPRDHAELTRLATLLL
ncbi:serine kinase [Dactylosporangium sp. NBC_01737]|uniref:phosphotransferase enzyme family protein n=1 Tax=Dactylosporangium sp. NBC_01737 TaxID=2975959 RepID=UPI002E111CD1|nr:serine kinase [Dactylosporangium sp. NBC_01737]